MSVRNVLLGGTITGFLIIGLACGGGGSSIPSRSSTSHPESKSSSKFQRQAPDTSADPQISSQIQSEPEEERYDPDQEDVKRWIRDGEPRIGNLRVGAIGSVPSLEITQVIDRTTAICTVGESLQFVIVKGFNMADAVDGQGISLPLAKVTGTTQYTTILGANKTVLVLEAFGDIDEARRQMRVEAIERRAEMDRIEAERKAEAERLAAEKAAEIRAAQFRVWETADAKFSVNARLERLSGDKVTLERQDNGELVEVDSTLLSDDDQEYIRVEFARRARQAREERKLLKDGP